MILTEIYLFCSCCLGSVKDEYSNLFQSFKIAWNSCRSFLGDQGKVIVSRKRITLSKTGCYGCYVLVIEIVRVFFLQDRHIGRG